MTLTQGMSESLVVGAESAFRTPGVNGSKVPVINPAMKLNRNTFRPASLTGSPQPRPVILGKKWVDVAFGVEASPESLMDPLAMLFGPKVTSGTAALYQHLFWLKAQGSWFIEQQHADLGKFPRWLGATIGSGSFGIEPEGVMDVRMAGLAARQINPTPSATQVSGVLTDRTSLLPFSYLLGRIRKDGVTLGYAKMFGFDVNRGVDKDFSNDETDEAGAIFTQVATISGRITGRLEDTTFVDASASGIECSLDFYVPAGQGPACFGVFPTVVLTPASIVTNGQGLVTFEGGFEAYARGTGSQFPGQLRSKWFTTDGTLPTLTLFIKLNGAAPITVTFAGGDTTPDLVVTRINATAGLAGVASVERMAGETGGVVVLKAPTSGAAGSIQVSGGTAQTALGLDGTTQTGLDNVALVMGLLNKVAA